VVVAGGEDGHAVRAIHGEARRGELDGVAVGIQTRAAGWEAHHGAELLLERGELGGKLGARGRRLSVRRRRGEDCYEGEAK
jgi:hypothetical protein